MAGCIKVIFSLLLVCIISSNTADWNRKLKLRPRHKRIFKRYGTTPQNKGHGQICITCGGGNGTSLIEGILGRRTVSLLYLLRFSPEYKYFFNGYVGIVSKFGVFDGMYNGNCYSILSLGVGLEWSYNGTGGDSRINKTYYGGSIGVLGLWGNTIDGSNKFTFESKKFGVQIRLTPFKMCKPNGLYMSADFGALDIRGLIGSDWFDNGIIFPIGANMAFNIGRSWWI